MNQPSIIIWGAGSIGRGFLGDLFHHAGYRIVFVDASPQLVSQLNARGSYPLVRNYDASRREDVVIDDYCAYTPDDTTALEEEIVKCDLLALAVFPGAFDQAAASILPLMMKRDAARNGRPLDILICTNLMHAAQHLRQAFEKACPPDWQAALEARLGLVETLVIRMVPQAPAEEKAKDPLLSWTNGYPSLPVEKHAFRGEIPHLPFFRLVENMRAEEMRKLYTYNMAHAVLAYHGARRGYRLITDCLADEAVRAECEAALEEMSLALQGAYGYAEEEMRNWNSNLLQEMDNPSLQDTVKRDGADPARKLRREDRLIGAALLAVRQGIQPRAILRAAGAALHYQEPGDSGAAAIAEKIAALGLRQAIQALCGLNADEEGMIDAIQDAYYRIPFEVEWEKKARESYEAGFAAEKQYHGCGQCVLQVLMTATGNFEAAVFNAATGLSGGLGLYGKATCSALTGSVMAFSLLYPRRIEEFDGAKENKYATFALSQRLIERFLEHYGSVLCHDIHTARLGRPFDLRRKEEREAFEDAGAHEGQCTETVGLAAKWAIEALAEKRIEEQVRRLKSA